MTAHTNVFMHTLHQCVLKLTAGNQTSDLAQLNEYPERALLLVESDDYIVLNHYPDQNYLNYLMDMGLGTQNLLIPTVQGESLSDNVLKDEQLLKCLQTLDNVVLHPYISTQVEAQIALKINATVNGSPPDLTQKVNNKCYLPALLQKLALPVLKHEIANSVTVIETAKAYCSKYKKIIIIGEQSYGGLAIWPIADEKALNAFQLELSKCDTNDLFLVEKLYDVLCSLNIQYHIGLNAIQELGITEQILDEKLKYHGNAYPLSICQLEKIRDYSRMIAKELQSQGYKGLLGIDLIETIDGDVFVVDLNGRANASSFGLNAIRKLFPDSQKYFRILTHLLSGKKTTFAELKNILGKENLFNRQSGQGILPYNIGFLQWEKFSAIVIANTQQELKKLCSPLYANGGD